MSLLEGSGEVSSYQAVPVTCRIGRRSQRIQKLPNSKASFFRINSPFHDEKAIPHSPFALFPLKTGPGALWIP